MGFLFKGKCWTAQQQSLPVIKLHKMRQEQSTSVLPSLAMPFLSLAIRPSQKDYSTAVGVETDPVDKLSILFIFSIHQFIPSGLFIPFSTSSNYIFIPKLNHRLMRLLLFLLFLAICAQSKLIYLLSYIRHGAIYPKTSLYDGNETKKFQGKLTPVGMRQQFNLGAYLRAEYIQHRKLTSHHFNPQEVEFFSSAVDRTSVSSLSFINGFFPLRKRIELPHGISQELLQPPYAMLFQSHLSTHYSQDMFLPPLSPHSTLHVLDACENYDNLKKVSESEVRQKIHALEKSQKKIIERLMKTFKLTPSQTNPNGLSDLYKVVYADQSLGRPLPFNFTEKDRKSLNYIYKYYNALIHQGSFLRYIITPTLQFLQEKLRVASNKTTTMKMGFVSLHESSSWPYLLILNLTTPDCITQQFKGQPVNALNCVEDLFFSSSILFELHEDVSFRQDVMVRYNGKYVNLCERQDIRCPIDEFLQRLKNQEIQYAQACKLPPNAPKPVHHASMRIQ